MSLGCTCVGCRLGGTAGELQSISLKGIIGGGLTKVGPARMDVALRSCTWGPYGSNTWGGGIGIGRGGSRGLPGGHMDWLLPHSFCMMWPVHA